MIDQPIPDARHWPWNTNIWRAQQQRTESFPTVYVTNRVSDSCALYGVMIFQSEAAREVVLQGPHGWRMVYFHQNCYVTWQRQE